jgi:hypothetical protein
MTQSRHSLVIGSALRARSTRLHGHKLSEGLPLRADAHHTRFCGKCGGLLSNEAVRANQPGIRNTFTSTRISLKRICPRSSGQEHSLAHYRRHIVKVL